MNTVTYVLSVVTTLALAGAAGVLILFPAPADSQRLRLDNNNAEQGSGIGEAAQDLPDGP